MRSVIPPTYDGRGTVTVFVPPKSEPENKLFPADELMEQLLFGLFSLVYGISQIMRGVEARSPRHADTAARWFDEMRRWDHVPAGASADAARACWRADRQACGG